MIFETQKGNSILKLCTTEKTENLANVHDTLLTPPTTREADRSCSLEMEREQHHIRHE
jgi:hypothetical protein